MRRARLVPLLCAALATSACERDAPAPSAASTASAPRAAPSFAQLGALAYRLPVTQPDPATGAAPETLTIALSGGRYEPDPALADDEHMVASGELATLYAVGELDGDGSPDAAVVLAWNGGGSGTFYELYAVLNAAEGLRVLEGVSLGDRIALERIAVVEGRVRVSFVGPGPDDPACCPSAKLDKAYAIDAGRLVEVPLPPPSL